LRTADKEKSALSGKQVREGSGKRETRKKKRFNPIGGLVKVVYPRQG